MQISVREEQGVRVLSVSGELDSQGCAQLTQDFDRLINGGARSFVIDLKGVTFIDSGGLSTLVRLFKRSRSSSGTLWLADLQPGVRRVFELTRLDRAFEIAPDAGQAVQRAAKG
ncbi:MAG: STAS domain-containing protein [Nitrospirales bacterium]